MTSHLYSTSLGPSKTLYIKSVISIHAHIYTLMTKIAVIVTKPAGMHPVISLPVVDFYFGFFFFSFHYLPQAILVFQFDHTLFLDLFFTYFIVSF